MTNLTNLRTALQQFDTNLLTPYAVGFDRTFDRLWDYAAHQAESTGYPPYNIVKDGDNGYKYTIEMALAGFDKKDIEIEFAEGVLTISSVKNEKEVNDNHIWKGISQRQFRRKFTLADEMVVNSATMENGMLKVELERIIPDAKKPQLIEVK
jgi:molecular chaperone IbpA